MKKIILTGCAGFVGSNIISQLLEKYKVVGIDSFETGGNKENIKNFLNHKNFLFLEQDLTEDFSSEVKKEIDESEVIFNLASCSSVEKSIQEPEKIVLNNITLMLNLLKRCIDKKFIHFSTDEVYGESLNYAHGENFLYHPSNPYAASKAMQENLIFSYWRTYGLKAIICNTINILGVNQTEDKFLPLVVKNIMQEKEVPIYTFKSHGYFGKRTYIDVRNVADALIFIEENIEPIKFTYKNKKEKPLKINITNEKEKPINNYLMARTIASILEKDADYSFIEVDKIRPGYDRGYLIKDKTLKSMGWKPKYHLKDSLKEIVNWYKNKYMEYEI